MESIVPVAMFSISPNKGNQNDVFTFDASESYDSNGSISNYTWEFNDGHAGATGKIITRKFDPGVYTAKLIVTDNAGISSSRTREMTVDEFTEIVCTEGVRNHGLIYGTVVGNEPGNNAIVKLDPGHSTCANSFYRCGDMRDAEVDLGFFGIVMEMADRGNNTFRVYNACPYHWPPKIGQRIFLFYKTCEENHC